MSGDVTRTQCSYCGVGCGITITAQNNGGARILRRGYNFVDGSDGLGHLDAGLFFLAYVRDPSTHFIPMQTRLASRDALQEYLRHTGSGLWAVLPGVNEGGWLGETLLA